MLWIGGQISTVNIIQSLFLPSVVSFIVPLVLIRSKIGEQLEEVPGLEDTKALGAPVKGGKYVTIAGLAALMAVPLTKTYTHLPPYMGMMIGLGVVWILAEWIHRHGKGSERKALTVPGALARVDVSSILFFMGILLAVASLETAGILLHVANVMNENLSDIAMGQFVKGPDVIVLIIGLLSSIVDNVPLVAATMGMYGMDQFPTDSRLWEFIAYCAGTGGSLLIIGSAAGVAAMGIEKINFMWYLKRISFAALLGYLAGAVVYLLTEVLINS
jgi:Na+/H+ antiporter NhaD/arsenite permease-like protein